MLIPMDIPQKECSGCKDVLSMDHYVWFECSERYSALCERCRDKNRRTQEAYRERNPEDCAERTAESVANWRENYPERAARLSKIANAKMTPKDKLKRSRSASKVRKAKKAADPVYYEEVLKKDRARKAKARDAWTTEEHDAIKAKQIVQNNKPFGILPLWCSHDHRCALGVFLFTPNKPYPL